jgi:hypothetical protein
MQATSMVGTSASALRRRCWDTARATQTPTRRTKQTKDDAVNGDQDGIVCRGRGEDGGQRPTGDDAANRDSVPARGWSVVRLAT